MKRFSEYFNNEKKLQNKPKVEEVPDYHGNTNKPPKEPTKKNVKNNQVKEWRSFTEYLDSKGNLNKPIIDKTLDQVDMPTDLTNAPPKIPSKGKNWIDNETLSDAPKPYKSVGFTSKPNSEKGLGDLGDKNLALKYDTEVDENSPYGGPAANSWTKTESFIQKNKIQFKKLNECGCMGKPEEEQDDTPYINVYRIGKVQPDPHETIRYLTKMAVGNPSILSGLVREMKRNNGMPLLLDEITNHPESYSEMARVLDDDEKGPKYASKLMEAMNENYSKFMDHFNESVGEPYHSDMDDDEENPMPKSSPEDEEGDDLEMDDMKPGCPSKDEEMPEENPDEEMPDEMPPEKPKLKFKKKFGHNHMLNAMKEYSYMTDTMKGMFKD